MPDATDIDEFDPTSGKERDLPEDTLTLTPPVPKPPAPITFQIPEDSTTVFFNLKKDSVDGNSVKLAIHHTGEWWDWRYDTFQMTKNMLQSMEKNFKKKVLHPNSPIDKQVVLQSGHGFLSEPPAAGWLAKLDLEKDGPDHWVLWGTFNLTADGKADIAQGKFAFVSPSYSDNYVEQVVSEGERKEHGPTLFHVALTNSPVLAELPHIALSKQLSSYDVRYVLPPEVSMDQPNGGTGDSVETTTEEPAAPPPAETTQLTKPTTPETNQDEVTLSKSEWEAAKLRMDNMDKQLKAQQRHNHELVVKSIVEKHNNTGIPPVMLSIVEAIMLNSHPEAQRAIDLTIGEESKAMNTYEAMQALLDNMPKVQLGQLTPESGSRPGPTHDLEAAEDEGRKMWASSGIVPGLDKKKGN